MRSNVNDKRFIDEFDDFKKFVTVELQNIKQKIANLYMKKQYEHGRKKSKNGRKHIIAQK